MPNAAPTQRWHSDYPDSHVSVRAQLGADVSVGPGSVIHDDVVIGDGTVIGECCVLGHRGPGGGGPLVIGAGSILRSHTVLYGASSFGPRLETGHHVVIRENTVAGENLRVGNFNDLEGNCSIGDFCRFHGYVHVGKGSRIGNFVWIFSLTTLTNDPIPPSTNNAPVTIEDGAVICVGATLMPRAVIGKGAFISSGAVARGVIPTGAVITGPEGRVVNHVSKLMDLASATGHPWMRHYERGFPPEVKPRLEKLLAEVMENRLTLKVSRPSP